MTELYLNEEEQKYRKIDFAHCEDPACGFLVKFEHSNCTFFICREHRAIAQVDLNNLGEKGAVCELHGPMERYDLLKDFNVCPICKESTLAILSVGRS